MGSKGLIIAWIICCLAGAAKAQTDTSFWFAAPEITYNGGPPHSDRPVSLHFTSLSQPAVITISQPANPSFTPLTITLPAYSSGLKDMTSYIDNLETKPANTALNYGLLVRSTALITAYYEESSANNPEMFVLKGRNALGTHFFIPAQNIMQNGLHGMNTENPSATSSFDIVATEDNTTVTIIPANDIVGHTAASGAFTIILNKGQTYSATAVGVTGSQHLMGSTVTSDKPVAITIKDDSIEGADGTTLGYCACEDLAGDQIVPVTMAGTRYISIPGYMGGTCSNNLPTDHIFILATQNNTTVTINGNPETILNKGQTYYKPSYNNVFYIETSEPAYVLQLSGFSCEVGNVLLPQLDCSGSKTVGFMRSENSSTFYMNILVPAGSEGKFTFNGTSGIIKASDFYPVPASPSWMYAQIPLTTAQLAVNAPAIITNPADFHLAIIEGDGNGARYGYFSGFNPFTAVPKSTPGTDKSFCEGDSIQLFCDVGAAEDITFLWTGPDGFTSTSQNPFVRNLTYAKSGAYTFIASKANCGSITDSIIVRVNPPVQRTLPVDTVKCEKDTLYLAVSSATTGVTFLWAGPNGYSGNTANSFIPAVSSANAGVYILTTTDASGCSVKDTLAVTVNSLPNSQATVTTPVCEKDTLFLKGTSTTEGVTFLWAGPNGYISSTPNNFIAAIPETGAGNYILVTTSPAGCSVRDTLVATVNPLPLLQADITTPVCEKDTLFLNGGSTTAGTVFQWTGPNSYISDQANNFIADIPEAAGGNYILTATSPAGCSVKDTLTLKVNLLPDSHATVSTPLCEKDALFFNGTSTMADAIFQWMGPGNYTSSATQGTIPSVSAANAGIYVLTVTSPAGCLTRDTATVIIKPLPSAAITGNTPCRLQTLQLDNNNTLSGSSYLWTNRNGFTSSQQNVSISPYNYADTGFYYLTVSTNGCLAKDSIDAGLRDIPAIRFIINGGICVNTESTQLDAADTSGLEGAGIFSGPGVSSAGVFIPSAAGVGASVIRYTYTGTDGCSGYKEQAISVYPVPVVTTLPGVSIWAGGSVLLNTTVTGNISSVTWSPTTGLNDPDILSPLATPLVSTHYIITVTSDSGCVVQDTTVIKVLKGITIPNAFSPNGDGINDKWMIDNLSGFAESTVDIFDRYGKKVFSSKGYTTPWDGNYNGKPLPVATYYYVITISDGYHRQTYSGWVVLLR